MLNFLNILRIYLQCTKDLSVMQKRKAFGVLQGRLHEPRRFIQALIGVSSEFGL